MAANRRAYPIDRADPVFYDPAGGGWLSNGKWAASASHYPLHTLTDAGLRALYAAGMRFCRDKGGRVSTGDDVRLPDMADAAALYRGKAADYYPLTPTLYARYHNDRTGRRRYYLEYRIDGGPNGGQRVYLLDEYAALGDEYTILGRDAESPALVVSGDTDWEIAAVVMPAALDAA